MSILQNRKLIVALIAILLAFAATSCRASKQAATTASKQTSEQVSAKHEQECSEDKEQLATSVTYIEADSVVVELGVGDSLDTALLPDIRARPSTPLRLRFYGLRALSANQDYMQTASREKSQDENNSLSSENSDTATEQTVSADAMRPADWVICVGLIVVIFCVCGLVYLCARRMF